MIKTILLVALAISAHAAAPTAVGTCTATTFAQCAQCISSTMVGAANAEVCATCNAGFSLPSTQACTGTGCSAYIANCAACATTATTCSLCIGGYGVDTTNNVCVSCTAGATGYTGNVPSATACTVAGATKVITITACDTGNGFALDSGLCVNCQTGKPTTGTTTYTNPLVGSQCTAASGAITQLSTNSQPQCIPKYGYDVSNTPVCGPCTLAANGNTYSAGDANALTCHFSTGTPQVFNLDSCVSGYGADATAKVCVNCATGKTSSGATTYTTPYANAAGCTITNSGTKISAVTACNAGFYLDSANSACISCATGKGASSGGIAQTYTGFDANCASCVAGATGAIACTGCNAGFFLFYNGTCGNGTANDTNCQYFSNQVHCVQCKSTMVTSASNNCVACPANCNLCDTTGKVCSVCGTGYKLSSTATGTCVPNSANIIVPGLALLSAIFYFLF